MLFALIEVSKKGKALMGGPGWEKKPNGGMGAPLNRGKAPVGGSGREKRPKGEGGKKTSLANLQPPRLML